MLNKKGATKIAPFLFYKISFRFYCFSYKKQVL